MCLRHKFNKFSHDIIFERQELLWMIFVNWNNCMIGIDKDKLLGSTALFLRSLGSGVNKVGQLPLALTLGVGRRKTKKKRLLPADV